MTLRKHLESIACFTGVNLKIHRISHSLTNSVYRLDSELKSWALRINNPYSAALGINRQKECDILMAIQNYSWSPNIVYIDNDLCLSKWIQGDRFNLEKDQNLERLIQLVKELHTVPCSQIQQHAAMDIRQEIRHLQAPSFYANQDWRQLLEQQFERYRLPANPVLCHFDLHPDNIIETEQSLNLLDWEYAALGDPLIDLAFISQGFSLDEPQWQQLIATFKPDEDELDLARCLAKITELLWHEQRFPEQSQLDNYQHWYDTWK
ncbi:phosphotransferase [Reinekea thalattae]|uniref:Phosphotransferase n=1 Tax=Reinekea thalattae TaxID=2593301 RepID=A0A5C8Z771_9GAMM|nr:phosphotransferase [Reinekea thalattae]TXR53001.1 phosphotransferase [Reinekea thalattae]